MTTLQDNWFAAGVAILEQIKKECPRFKRHSFAPSLFLVKTVLAGVFPSVCLIPGPLSGGEANPQQAWFVAIYARNVEQIAEGTGLMREAGALISSVMQALAGFVPGPEFSPLFMPTESHEFPDVGQGIYVLTYATRIEPDFWPYYR